MDRVAEAFDAFSKAEKDFEGMDVIEEIGTEFAVGIQGFEHMIDGDGQRVGDGNDGLLLAAPWAASTKAARRERLPLRVLPLLHLPALSFWPGQILIQEAK